MSHPLSAAQLAELEALMRERQRDVMQQLEAHQEGQGRVDHAREVLQSDSDDASQHDAEREIDFAIGERDSAELAALQQALDRLAAGQYGRCVDCGEGIAFARLKLTPQALRCVACEAQYEGPGTPRARL